MLVALVLLLFDALCSWKTWNFLFLGVYVNLCGVTQDLKKGVTQCTGEEMSLCSASAEVHVC